LRGRKEQSWVVIAGDKLWATGLAAKCTLLAVACVLHSRADQVVAVQAQATPAGGHARNSDGTVWRRILQDSPIVDVKLTRIGGRVTRS
jgi:nicotinamide mononucleotide (NMN) deamidase PncC